MNDIKNPSDLNSWEYVREIRHDLINEEKVFSSMEPVWQSILNEQLVSFRDQEGNLHQSVNDFRTDEQLGETPLMAFMSLIDRCQYPPPEILIAIRDCLELYLGAGGQFELDQVFFGDRRVQKVGNKAAVYSRDQKYRMFELLYSYKLLGFFEQDSKPKKKMASIREYLASIRDFDTDPYTFLKGYNRWKKKQIEDK